MIIVILVLLFNSITTILLAIRKLFCWLIIFGYYRGLWCVRMWFFTINDGDLRDPGKITSFLGDFFCVAKGRNTKNQPVNQNPVGRYLWTSLIKKDTVRMAKQGDLSPTKNTSTTRFLDPQNDEAKLYFCSCPMLQPWKQFHSWKWFIVHHSYRGPISQFVEVVTIYYHS